MKKVSGEQVVASVQAPASWLPPQIQEALGELVGAAREGLLALSVGVGLGVVHELMESEVKEVVGPKGEHNPERVAVRHGHENGSMTLGGRRVKVSRVRVRSADDERELPLATYEYFAERDPLTRAVMDRMLAGVSTRKFADVGEPVGEEIERSSAATGKTSVSDMFIERTRTALSELMGRGLEDVRLAVMMLDGVQIADRTHVVALGITTEGVKVPLGLWEGSTENATLARTLLADLVDRGLDPEQAILFVIDGSKALRRAVKDVFGEHALVQRCHRHKECHGGGPPAGADFCVGNYPKGGPEWSMSGLTGRTGARGGARRIMADEFSARTGSPLTRTASRGWSSRSAVMSTRAWR